MLSNETRSSYFSPRRSESLYFFSDIYMYSLSALSTVTNEERESAQRARQEEILPT